MVEAFNLDEGIRQRDIGMQLAADNRKRLLDVAKIIAVEIALQEPDHCCCIDMVHQEMGRRGLPPSLGQAAGSVFRASHWEFSHNTQTVKTTSHGREIKVWKLKGMKRDDATLRGDTLSARNTGISSTTPVG